MNPFRLELSSSIRVSVSAADAWAVFADVSRWTEWCSVCLKADVATDFDWSISQRIGLKFRMAGVGVPFNVEIVDSEPGRRIAWSSTKFTVTAVRTFDFVDNADGTSTVTDHKLFTSPVLPLRLFYPRPIIRRMTESMLADLAAECDRAGRS